MRVTGYRFFLLALLCFFCSGCAFHLRSKSDFPKTLSWLYFSSEKPYSVLSTQLTNLFQSMDVHLVKNPSAAPFTLLVTHDHFSYSRPDIVNTSLPTNINFLQTATVTLKNNQNNAPVISRSFSATESLTLNANQIYTNNANGLIKQALNRRVVSLIYYWLVSTNTTELLNHATISQTARHTP